MSAIRGAGVSGGMALGQVDVDALAALIRRKSAELDAAAALFAQRTGQHGSCEEPVEREVGR